MPPQTSAAVRLAPFMSSKGIETLQRGMGRDAVVTLPGGHRFNTRLIGDDGKYGMNNCLLGQGGDNDMTVTAPGMKSRLYPTFKNMTTNFVLATKYGPSAAVLVLQLAISVTRSAIVDLTQLNDAVDLTKDGEAAEVGVVTAFNGNVKVPPGFQYTDLFTQLTGRNA